MQISSDRPEIIQIQCFIKHTKGSYLDFQFILPKKAKKIKNIQISIIFVNNISYIHLIIAIITK